MLRMRVVRAAASVSVTAREYAQNALRVAVELEARRLRTYFSARSP
jgi:hypothetical protein